MVCCPARAALMTGRHPQRSGITNWTQGDRHGTDSRNINMAAEEVTLAEAMKAAGYRTALFGKWHLGAKVGHGPLDKDSRHFLVTWEVLSITIDTTSSTRKVITTCGMAMKSPFVEIIFIRI